MQILTSLHIKQTRSINMLFQSENDSIKKKTLTPKIKR
jgi:hypothetical protein